MAFVVGLDWGGAAHAVCVVDRESGAVGRGWRRAAAVAATRCEQVRTASLCWARVFARA
jgi:hypothetical protein